MRFGSSLASPPVAEEMSSGLFSFRISIPNGFIRWLVASREAVKEAMENIQAPVQVPGKSTGSLVLHSPRGCTTRRAERDLYVERIATAPRSSEWLNRAKARKRKWEDCREHQSFE